MLSHESLIEFYRPLLAAGDFCFDVGANRGDYSRAMLSLGARVLAVEPQPDLCALMSEAFRAELEARQIRILMGAVGASNGKATLFPATDLTKSMSTLSPLFLEISERNGDRWNRDEAYEVAVWSLDHLIAAQGMPYYVKIDVEGLDSAVLAGLSCPIALVSFEYNTQPGLIEVAGSCVDQLAALGPYVFNYVPEGQNTFAAGDWMAPLQMRDVLFRELGQSMWFGDIYARVPDAG